MSGRGEAECGAPTRAQAAPPLPAPLRPGSRARLRVDSREQAECWVFTLLRCHCSRLLVLDDGPEVIMHIRRLMAGRYCGKYDIFYSLAHSLSNGLVTSFGLESVPGCCHPALHLGTRSHWRLMWHGWLHCDNCWASTGWAPGTTLRTFFIVFLSSLPSGLWGRCCILSQQRGRVLQR